MFLEKFYQFGSDHFLSHGRGAARAGGQTSILLQQHRGTEGCSPLQVQQHWLLVPPLQRAFQLQSHGSASAKIKAEHLWLRGDECAAGTPRFLWVTLLFKVNTIILIITWISISIGCLRVGIYLHPVMQESVSVGMCKS